MPISALWQSVHAVDMVQDMPSRTTADLISIADGAGAGKSRLLSEPPERLLQAVTATKRKRGKLSLRKQLLR